MGAPFRVEKQDGVAWLVFDRPEKHNAMDLDFFYGIREHMNIFDREEEVRVVVLQAEGRTFSSGIDLEWARSLFTDKSAAGRENLRKDILDVQDCFSAIERCRKPVIAAIQGHCIGAGVDLISTCDIRIASADAVFSIRETRMGIIADVGTLQRLPRLIGFGPFTELALTARDFGAEEAEKMGLITRIADSREALNLAAGELAGRIASLPPLTVQGVKDVILFSRDHDIATGLEYVAQKNAAALMSEDLFEAMAAFMEKRKPIFKGN